MRVRMPKVFARRNGVTHQLFELFAFGEVSGGMAIKQHRAVGHLHPEHTARVNLGRAQGFASMPF